MMNLEALEALAKQAEKQGDNALAIILFTYLGAVHMGAENELASYVTDFAKQAVHSIEYSRWVKGG